MIRLNWRNEGEYKFTTNLSLYDWGWQFLKRSSEYLADWLEVNNPFHPGIAVWGASRISRRRARLLNQYGIETVCYIDTKRNRQLDKMVRYYQDIPPPGELFILTYIKQMNARKEIQEFLNGRGYKEGFNYLLVS